MTKEDIMKPENLVYQKPRLLNDNAMHYCPGCSHGVVHKLIAEVIEEMKLEEKIIGISPVGCAVFMYNYLDIDCQEAAHGRAPALASAIKRLWPDRLVFTYQGDGDLACIGTAETIHALNRGENITIIFINNAIYGMTGGQMAPTTLLGMKTATCPYGRIPEIHGYPLKMTEMHSWWMYQFNFFNLLDIVSFSTVCSCQFLIQLDTPSVLIASCRYAIQLEHLLH